MNEKTITHESFLTILIKLLITPNKRRKMSSIKDERDDMDGAIRYNSFIGDHKKIEK